MPPPQASCPQLPSFLPILKLYYFPCRLASPAALQAQPWIIHQARAPRQPPQRVSRACSTYPVARIYSLLQNRSVYENPDPRLGHLRVSHPPRKAGLLPQQGFHRFLINILGGFLIFWKLSEGQKAWFFAKQNFCPEMQAAICHWSKSNAGSRKSKTDSPRPPFVGVCVCSKSVELFAQRVLSK